MLEKIILTDISIDDVIDFRSCSHFKNILNIKPNIPDRKGLTCDSYLYDVTILFISTTVPSVVLNLLSSWIYDKYKENRIKKPMINGIEIDIENITPEEILAIFAKDKHVDASEDGTKE